MHLWVTYKIQQIIVNSYVWFLAAIAITRPVHAKKSSYVNNEVNLLCELLMCLDMLHVKLKTIPYCNTANNIYSNKNNNNCGGPPTSKRVLSYLKKRIYHFTAVFAGERRALNHMSRGRVSNEIANFIAHGIPTFFVTRLWSA